MCFVVRTGRFSMTGNPRNGNYIHIDLRPNEMSRWRNFKILLLFASDTSEVSRVSSFVPSSREVLILRELRPDILFLSLFLFQGGVDWWSIVFERHGKRFFFSFGFLNVFLYRCGIEIQERRLVGLPKNTGKF